MLTVNTEMQDFCSEDLRSEQDAWTFRICNGRIYFRFYSHQVINAWNTVRWIKKRICSIH